MTLPRPLRRAGNAARDPETMLPFEVRVHFEPWWFVVLTILWDMPAHPPPENHPSVASQPCWNLQGSGGGTTLKLSSLQSVPIYLLTILPDSETVTYFLAT